MPSPEANNLSLEELHAEVQALERKVQELQHHLALAQAHQSATLAD